MPNVIMTIPNAFKSTSERLKDFVPTTEVSVDSDNTSPGTVVFTTNVHENQDNNKFVRRPLSGMAVKPNTHAFIQVVDSQGQPVRVFNQIGSLGNIKSPPPDDASANQPLDEYWTDWLLQSVSEQRMEKTQIVETFGSPVFYVFGERPRILQFQGILVNTADFNWRAEFWENWDKYFRATKLIEQGNRMFIGFDDIIVSGYPMSANAIQNTMQPHQIGFSFSFFVVDYMNTSMMDIGSVQQNRLRIPSGNKALTQRLNEFLPQSGFQDTTLARAAERGGDLARIVGGDNLLFREFFNSTFGGLGALGVDLPAGGGSANLNDLLFDPGLRHVRGAKSATDFLLTHLNKVALRYAYQGVTELGKVTPGGVQGLTFWFGLTAHLYQQVAINAVQSLGGRTEENRWADLIDNMSTIGSPFGVASYLGYATNAALGTALRSATGSLELSNLEYDVNLGLVSKKQSPSLGAKISFRQDPAQAAQSTGYYNSLLSQSQQQQDNNFSNTSFGAVSGTSAAQGQFETDPVLPGNTEQVDAQTAFDTKVSTEEEIKAIDAQSKNSELRHGGAVVIDSAADIEDDGAEED